ncbi:MAG: GerMN domain-containing protein [Bacilli bacterium]|nr:GerMN domain-containing protein [Bacilli bacterium]
MLKRFWVKRIFISTSALFAILLLYIIPSTDELDLTGNLNQELSYVDNEIKTNEIFLLDSYNYLARTQVVVSETEIEKKATELINILISGGSGESKVPNGFKAVLPSETKILSIEYNDGVLKVNFSSELLDVDEKHEEKIIEALVYTLTSIDGVDNIIIYIDGNVLNKLPKTGINLPSTLNRKYGINKKYDIKNTKNICSVTVYYVNKYNDDTYYVPVTKYMNDDREKIKIIVEELTSSSVYNSNLMSYLNSNTKLLAANETIDKLDLNFNAYIFNNYDEKDILEEVIYTIGLSVRDNYDVKEVNILVDDEEIIKSVLKTIE